MVAKQIKEKKLDERIINKGLVWLISCIVLLIVGYVFKDSEWKYDCYDYWTRGENLKNEMFNIAKIDGFRGYIFILYLGLTNFLGGKKAWIIINAIVTSFCQSFILPNLVADLAYNKKDSFKVICVNIIIVILFVGEFAYPLSDFFALMNCCYSIYFLKKSMKCLNKAKYLYIFLGGVFLYWAYNTRTIYMFAGIAIIIIYVLMSIFDKGIGKIRRLRVTVIRNLVIVVGCFVASIPQIIMNYSNQGRFSMGVPTNGLMLQQMFWGIQNQRYDTYVGNATDILHPNPGVHFVDLTGMKILDNLQMTQFETWGDFFKVFFSNPIDVIIMYFRHCINFIFPCWPEAYINDLNSSKFLLGLLGGSIIFLTLVIFFERCIVDYKSIISYIPIIIPALLIIPGAVEYRFSLPIYVFAISQICFNVDSVKFKKVLSNNKVKMCLMYIIFMLFCFAIWSNMLASESIGALLF